MTSRRIPAIAILLAAVLAVPVHGQESPPAEAPEESPQAAAPGTPAKSPQAAGPLAPFERLVGGRWEMEGSYQEFEWGLGRKSVHSRSFFVSQGRSRQVSEGSWYWHPGEKEIRGLFVAVDMPVELFLYTTRFEGDRMISRMETFTGEGGEAIYTETFEFKGSDRYVWTLYEGDGTGAAVAMSGTFVRK